MLLGGSSGFEVSRKELRVGRCWGWKQMETLEVSRKELRAAGPPSLLHCEDEVSRKELRVILDGLKKAVVRIEVSRKELRDQGSTLGAIDVSVGSIQEGIES